MALYAAIVFLIYGWAITIFLWKVPSWIYFLSLGEIAAVLSYTLASCLLESTIILFLFLFVGVILPRNWLADKFVVRGGIIFYILTFWVALFHLTTLIQRPTSNDIIKFGFLAILTIGLAIVVADRISFVQNILLALGDRLTVFLYLWLPLSAVGILVILFRIL